MRETRELPRRVDGDGPDAESAGGRMLLAISNAVVGLHKEYRGKGPTKARSFLSQDVLVVVLEGGLTRGEETLLEHGFHETVGQARHALHQSAQSEMRQVVEEITGRRVRSVMSANDPREQVELEIFMLEPAGAMDAEEMGRRAEAARAERHDLSAQQRALLEEQKQAAREMRRRREEARKTREHEG